jgi:hypothetical protein
VFGLCGGDAGGGVLGSADGRLWAAAAGDHPVVHRGLSPVQTHDPDRPGGSVRRVAGTGDGGALEPATTQALATPVAEARAYVQSKPAAYLEETGWREGQERAWLWTAVTTWVIVLIM